MHPIDLLEGADISRFDKAKRRKNRNKQGGKKQQGRQNPGGAENRNAGNGHQQHGEGRKEGTTPTTQALGEHKGIMTWQALRHRIALFTLLLLTAVCVLDVWTEPSITTTSPYP